MTLDQAIIPAPTTEIEQSDVEDSILEYIDKFGNEDGAMEVFKELEALDERRRQVYSEPGERATGTFALGSIGSMFVGGTAVVLSELFGVNGQTAIDALFYSLFCVSPFNGVLSAYLGRQSGIEWRDSTLEDLETQAELLQEARDRVFDTAYDPQDIVLVNHESQPTLMYGKDVKDHDVVSVMDEEAPVNEITTLDNTPVLVADVIGKKYPALASHAETDDEEVTWFNLSVYSKSKQKLVTRKRMHDAIVYLSGKHSVHDYVTLTHLTPRRSRGPYR